VSYIHVIDARAAYGYGGKSQEFRHQHVDSRISVSSVVRAAGLYSVPMFTSVKGCKFPLHRSHRMKQVTLPGGERVPALGMGTWNIGDHRNTRRGNRHAATGSGHGPAADRHRRDVWRRLVGVTDRRSDPGVATTFLVSKVYPHNASRKGAVAACERSLRRLGTDHIDLYLLHWRGDVPFEATIEAFLALRQAGKIRHFGVSNLDLSDMEELWDVPGGDEVAVNQLLYNLSRRGIEFDLLPWLRERKVPVMAYSPIEQARCCAARA
jgi:diketogulonate reductase-like aldo/keto reductase